MAELESTPTLLPKNAFRAELARERMRSDRSTISFSLLTLEPARRAGKFAAMPAIVHVATNCIRETDVAGWMSNRKVGIILPYTPAEGAWKLADKLTGQLADQNISVRCEVFVYPSADPPDEGSLDDVVESGAVLNGSRGREQPMEMLFVRQLSAGKRLIDIAGSLVLLMAAFPVMLLAAIGIKLTSRGPIFFAQQRDGLGGRRFHVYKFRTMVVDAEALKAKLRSISEQDGPAFKLKNDPRVTPIGRWLRRTCIDELPQLINVLKGDMSLVGPRPMCSKEARHCTQWERRRLDITPGLTCIWQVHGGTKVTFSEWMRMDLRYARTASLWQDVRLILLTVPSVIRRDGVY